VVDFTKMLLDRRLDAVRQSGRGMPASREERQHALTILEWAHSSQDAEQAAPDDVRLLRVFWERPFVDEAHWRVAYDLALDAWKKAYEIHKQKQAVF
jgi:hypothetical protein